MEIINKVICLKVHKNQNSFKVVNVVKLWC